jgi:DNA-binding CsgD family transcriptional regulator
MFGQLQTAEWTTRADGRTIFNTSAKFAAGELMTVKKAISHTHTHAERALACLTNLVYRCAAHTQFWPDFLAKLSEATHATHAIVVARCSSSGQPAVAAFIGINLKCLQAFEDNYCRYCKAKPCKVSIPGAPAVSLDGLVLNSQMMCLYIPRANPKRLLRVHSVTFLKEQCCGATLNVFRPKGSKPFGRNELALIHGLTPHLQCVAEINRTATCLQTEKDAAWEALDRMPIGVILVNKKGHILMMNHNARAIIDENDGISVSGETLYAARNDETEALVRLVTGTATGGGSDVHASGVLTLTRPSARRSLSVAVTPLRSKQYFLQCGKPTAAIFISDPEHAMETKANALRRFYDLTPAEARLASLLTQGRNLKLAARDLHVTYSSARNHLKHVFLKTRTGRQSELVRLLLSSPAAIDSV